MEDGDENQKEEMGRDGMEPRLVSRAWKGFVVLRRSRLAIQFCKARRIIAINVLLRRHRAPFQISDGSSRDFIFMSARYFLPRSCINL